MCNNTDEELKGEYAELTPEHLQDIAKIRNGLKKKRDASAKKTNKDSPNTDSLDEEFQPEVTLKDGEQLPQYYGKCPKNLMGKLIEDLDPYYKERGIPTFCVATPRFQSVYLYRFTAERSCFLLSPFNPIRQLAVRVSVNQFFDYFVMLTIVVNCVFLALDNEIAESEYVFTTIYTIEMIIKLIARGVVMHPFTYLRDGWNWLDFVVVILAWVTIIITSLGSHGLNLSGLRTFRVIRALRSFTIVPGLKTIVNALLQSLKPLAEVMVIMVFLLVVISLIALQAYQGVLKRKCVRYGPELFSLNTEQYNEYVQNKDNWNDVEGELVVCGNASSSGLCPDGYVCLQDVGDNPNYGYTNFDHFGWAMLTSFQLITLDFWENVYNMIIRAEGAWNVLFFFMSVVLGPFYLLNLLLAVVAIAYMKEHEKQEKLREIREQAKKRAKRKQKRRRKLEEEKQRKERPDQDVVIEPAAKNGDTNRVVTIAPSPLTRGAQNEETPRNNSASENSERKSMRKDMSVESGESAASSTSVWRTWMEEKCEYWNGLCCSWKCCACFYKFQDVLLQIVKHKAFRWFVVFSIVINTAFLAMDHHNIEPTFENVLNIGNYVFTGIFAVEAVLKITALGFDGYFKKGWNIFDFSIVVISLVEFALPSGTGALSVLRSLRLMRVFRLARIWSTMKKLMSIILKSLKAVIYLTVVLFLVLFIFAVVGKQVFGSQYANSASKFDDQLIPRWNFINFYNSFLLVWRVMCGEWIEPLHDCMHIEGPLCIPVFLSITFIGNFLVLNLFTAILLEAFSVDDLKKKSDKKDIKDKKTMGIFLKALSKFNKIKKKRRTAKVEEETNIGAEEGASDDEEPETANDIKEAAHPPIPEKKRSISYSNIFALDQSSLRLGRSNLQESIREANEIASDRHTAKRKTLIKQPRINEDDVHICEPSRNGYENQSASAQNQVDGSLPEEDRDRKFSNDDPSLEEDSSTKDPGKIMENETRKPQGIDGKPPRCLPAWCHCCCNKKGDVFKQWSICRKVIYQIVEHRLFEWFILIVIIGSTVSLALEDVNLKNLPERERILNIFEYVFTVIFTVEMLMKWIGIGWSKYFTDWWCIIDFGIVVISWIGIGAASASSQVESLKALRTLRALRPLRAISRWQGMKVVVNALVYCIPSIANVLCVCLLIWLVFSIIGVQLFKGQFYRCVDAAEEVLNASIIANRTMCLSSAANYSWITPRINFNNVVNGMIALFQVATFEGWMEVMADASDITGVDQQPVRGASRFSYIFFFIFVLIGSFFILNLIVGVIIESFQKLRKETESSTAIEAFLTDSQKNFYKTMRTMLNRKPKKTIPKPENHIQLKIFELVTHSRFEVAVFSVIVLNMITLAMEHYKMSDTWTIVLRYVDIAFTVVFVIEALLKIIGLRFYYFRDPFNVFDFVVVILSVVGFILEELLTFLVSPTLLRVVRVFRVFRVLRVVRAARGIRRLILTLMISLPALFNIAVLLGVFMVIFAILGMSFFMDVKLRGALNDIVNFQTFGNSMMLLFRLMTSAGWNDVLDPLMDETDCNGADCGKYHIAIIYFVSYVCLVFLVVVNMYIAIILENFYDIFEQEASGIGQDDFEFFYVVWSKYDPKASQFVSLSELSNLLHSLHPPFQLAKPNDIKIAALDLPIVDGDKVHCLDVLFSLVRRIIGEVEISDQMRQEAEHRLLKSFPNRKSMKADTSTLKLRQRVKAARIIQDAWRGFNSKRRRTVEGHTNDIFSMSSAVSAMKAPPAQEIIEMDTLKVAENDASLRNLSSEPKKNQVAPSPEKTTVVEIDETHKTSVKKRNNSSSTAKVAPTTEILRDTTLQSASSASTDSEKDSNFDLVTSSAKQSALIIKNKFTEKGNFSVSTASSTLSNEDTVDDAKPSTKQHEDKSEVRRQLPKEPFVVKRTLPTPVSGKDIKFNPQIGQFKQKTNKKNDLGDTKVNGNDSLTPKSSTIVKEKASPQPSPIIVKEKTTG